MLTALVAVVGFAAPAHAADPWTWVDRGPKLLDVSCSAQDRCVGVGVGGAVLYQDAGGLHWSSVALDDTDPPDALVAVACTPARCIAVSRGTGDADAQSLVSRSTDGGATWSAAAALPAATGIGGATTRYAADVACDPRGDCVIAGRAGGIWRSTNGGVGWSPISTGTPVAYRKVTCPDTGVCILLGDAQPTANPTSVVLRGTTARTVDAPARVGPFTAIACESRTTCTAADSLRHVTTISGDFRAWGAPKTLPAALGSIVSLACPAANTCVGITGTGGGVRTANRADGEWVKRPTHSVDLDALDCRGAHCAAVGDHASWFGSPNTGIDWFLVNFAAEFDAIDCSGASCIGGGKKDLGVSGTAGDLWVEPIHEFTALNIGVVSCIAYPQCLALGKERTLATVDGGRSWQGRWPGGSVSAGPESGVCVTKDQCVGLGGGGVFTTFDGARTPWWMASMPTEPAETLSVACPTPTRCVAAGRETIYRGTLVTTEGSVEWTWVASDAQADPGFPVHGITCTSPSRCVAVGGGWQVFTTTDPELLHWEKTLIADRTDEAHLQAVSCASERVCVAVGDRGRTATTDDGWKTWTVAKVGGDPRPNLTGVRCLSATRCVAIGQTVMVAGRPGAA